MAFLRPEIVEVAGIRLGTGGTLPEGPTQAGHLAGLERPADRIDGLLAQATTTPQLCRIGNDWFMVRDGRPNILLQKSATGKAEGPYDDFAYLATHGGHPSLLVDDDGTVYLVFADAWIAKLKPDLKELAEDPRLLLPVPNPDRLTLGDPGVALFKRGGKYCVLAARWQVRDGRPSHDAVLWMADTIYGPYQETSVVLPGSGTVSVFSDASGKWHAVSSQPGALRIVEVPSHENCLLHGFTVVHAGSVAPRRRRNPRGRVCNRCSTRRCATRASARAATRGI